MRKANPDGLEVAVIVGATSKWQANGANTRLHHGGSGIDDSDLPVSARWGIGGGIAQKFAAEGMFVVLTTRSAPNAAGLLQAITDAGGRAMVVELDVGKRDSVEGAFARIRYQAGDPDVLVYNPGWLEGRELPADKTLTEYFPPEKYEVAIDVACRGPFLVAREVLPAMRERGRGSFFFTNNSSCLRGKARLPGESLYFPRVMTRHFAQVLTEEYTPHGIHVANVILSGMIDSPGTRSLPHANKVTPMEPAKIAEVFWWLYEQDPNVWTHEIRLTTAPRFPVI